MKRFENAQVGDKVYSMIHGYGEIIYIDKFILKCRFDIKNHQIDSEYLLDGKCFENDAEPTLFYSDGTNNYLTERPESKSEINWEEWDGKDIKIFHEYFGTWEKRKLIKYIPAKENKFLCENGQDSEIYTAFDKARLIEEKELEIDWSKVDQGTIIVVVSQNGTEYNKPFYTYLYDKIFPILTKDNANGIEEWKKARLINGTV